MGDALVGRESGSIMGVRGVHGMTGRRGGRSRSALPRKLGGTVLWNRGGRCRENGIVIGGLVPLSGASPGATEGEEVVGALRVAEC